MITTGACPNFPAPWPSPTLLTDAEIAPYNEDAPKRALYRADRLLNAGVGGDRIQNLVYRLVGDEHEGGTLPGLLPLLARCGTVQTWVLHIGAENVSPDKMDGLAREDIQALEKLVLALLRVRPAGGVKSKVVLTLMFGERMEVWRGNEQLKHLEKKLDNPETGHRNVRCLRTPGGYSCDKHLVDDVHLNFDGYRLWAEYLWTMAPVGIWDGRGYNVDLRKKSITETETKGANGQMSYEDGKA